MWRTDASFETGHRRVRRNHWYKYLWIAPKGKSLLALKTPSVRFMLRSVGFRPRVVLWLNTDVSDENIFSFFRILVTSLYNSLHSHFSRFDPEASVTILLRSKPYPRHHRPKGHSIQLLPENLKPLVCFVDRASWHIRAIRTNRMHYSLSIYFNN